MYTTLIDDLPFQTHDATQPTKNKNSRPTTNPIQPNLWVSPTHGQLSLSLAIRPWLRDGVRVCSRCSGDTERTKGDIGVRSEAAVARVSC